MNCDSSILNPPRYWWLKRLAIAYLLLAGGTVGLRYYWLNTARRAVDAQLASYRQAGQPVLAPEFAAAALPDSENAAVALRRAAAELDYSADERAMVNQLPSGGPTRAEMPALARLVDAHAGAVAEVRRARSLAAVDWKTDFNQPMARIVLPQVSAQRQLALFLKYAALVAQERGQDVEAIERCRDILPVARGAAQLPALIGLLVGVSIDDLAATTVWKILPTLRLADPQARRAAEGLIRDLLDDQWFNAAATRTALLDRAFQIDFARRTELAEDQLRAGTATAAEQFVTWWFAPVIEGDLRSMIGRTTVLAGAAGAGDVVAMGAMMPPSIKSSTGATDAIFHVVSGPLAPRLYPAFARRYQVQHDCRAAAIDLAGRLYELDHGSPPSNVGDLMPKYLPSVPVDPTTGQPMTRTFSAVAAPATGAAPR